MRPILFLATTALLLGCQRQPDPQLTRLQAQLTAQQDTVRQLRRQLAATQQRLEETALMANAIARGEAAAAPAARPRPAAAPPGTLYGKPAITPLPDLEMAEVLSVADSTSGENTESFGARAYLACNGPADATVDECNCSHYVYLALTTAEQPLEYKLFRLGPFYEARFAGWEKSPGPQPERLTLRIRHDVKGRAKTDTFRIGWAGVQQL